MKAPYRGALERGLSKSELLSNVDYGVAGGSAVGCRDPGVSRDERLVAGPLQPLPIRCYTKRQVRPKNTTSFH